MLVSIINRLNLYLKDFLSLKIACLFFLFSTFTYADCPPSFQVLIAENSLGQTSIYDFNGCANCGFLYDINIDTSNGWDDLFDISANGCTLILTVNEPLDFESDSYDPYWEIPIDLYVSELTSSFNVLANIEVTLDNREECNNPDACNYIPEDPEDDGSCVYSDCAGECGGSAYEVTLCEDTDGDGLGNPGSETTECVEGGRDITDGCDLAENTVFITSGGSVLYNSTDAIGGFQFSIDGASSDGVVSGGDAGAAGFMMSAGETTVVGFSLTGDTFGPGCGIITNLTLDGEAIGLSSLVFSDASGTAIPFEYFSGESAGNLVGDLGKGLAKDAITGVGLELGKDLISDVEKLPGIQL